MTEISSRFGCVILDECHHCPATSFMYTLQQFPARYRFGLTATPTRRDGLEMFMTSIIGPVRHEITRGELEKANVLVTPEIRFVATTFEHCGDDWNDLLDELTTNTDRNNQAYRILSALARDGRRILALTARVDHAKEFAMAWEIRHPGTTALAVGRGMNKKERAEAISRITDERAQVLFSTSLADEGLNIPALDACVLLTPSRDGPRTTQRVGRILRSVDGKKTTIVFDLVDVHVPLLKSQALTRFFKAYRQISPGTKLPDWLEYRRRAA
jgi:superfamily II DNA or RNA helicase